LGKWESQYFHFLPFAQLTFAFDDYALECIK